MVFFLMDYNHFSSTARNPKHGFNGHASILSRSENPHRPIPNDKLHSMIRMIQSNSADQAKAYFSDALSKSDYYVNDQELSGTFRGRLAERLGIKGPATREAFFDLSENRNPITKENLTPRTKDNRTTGYDINFHCPKSVSVLHVLSKDNHILSAFEKSVYETMQDIEKAAKTRIRLNREYADRETEELIWADFIHQTARPVSGHAPDPHLHAHCFVFNATWDQTEKKYKAAKFREIKQDMPYFQKQFHKRLADNLVNLGYHLRLTDNSFEIEGVPHDVIRHFSKRTNEIGQIAKERGITDAKALDELGARSRTKKQKGWTMESLKEDWKRQMLEISHDTKVNSHIPIRHAPSKATPNFDAKDCIDHSIKHCFERASVVPDKKILQTAYRFAMGNVSVSVSDIISALKADNRMIYSEHGTRILCTTKETLKEEKRMVELAREGIGKLTPLYSVAPTFKIAKDQQANAVAHVLTTRNRVSIIQGAAGTGKTKMMQEAVDWIEKTGKEVIAVAPTSQAARGVLKDDGFKDAETVAMLLSNSKLQDKLSGQVLWVDEAGLLGTQDMTALLDLAIKKNARVILGGDTRQHSSVARGDALRILNTVGKIATAEVSKIRRQKTEHYRSLVEDLFNGKIKEAFKKLDHSSAIKTIDPLKPQNALVDDYMTAIEKKKSVLVISPTHKQGSEVTAEIRDRMRRKGRIGRKEVKAVKYTNLNWTQAEKGDWRNYQVGHVIQFSQNLKKVKRGSLWCISAIKGNDITIVNEKGGTITMPRTDAKNFDVFDMSPIGISIGDQIRITRNGFDQKKKRLDNGSMLKVKSITRSGQILLHHPKSKTKFQIDANFGHLDHAYCITSHASQGKTVDQVFISQPSSTFAATDMKQFYVSVSRGREAVHIYTDDKLALLESASEMGDRQSALELVENKKMKTSDHIQRKQRGEYIRINRSSKAVTKNFSRNIIDFEHEPRI